MVPNEDQIRAAQERIAAFAALSLHDKCDAIDYRDWQMENLSIEEKFELVDSEAYAQEMSFTAEFATYELPKIDEFSSISERQLYDRILTAKQSQI